MGAYAALSSLMKTLEQLRQSNPRLICGSEQHVESTYQNLCALQAFLEDTPKEAIDPQTLDALEKKIRAFACKAEDAVDSSLRSIVLADITKNRERARTSFLFYFSNNQRALRSFKNKLVKAEKKIYSLKKKAMQIEFNKHGRKYMGATKPSSSSSERSAIDDKHNVVIGMKDDFNIILDRLLAQTDELIVIPIVGMGGIGKTTLARKAFLDSSVQHRFDKHALVTISETYNERQILLQLVSSIAGDRIERIEQMSNDRLTEIVYRGLNRRRYLIVIDDLWNTDHWDQMRRSFPDDNNKSRILLTTRLKYVAEYASGPDFPPHSMSFLSLGDSWNLFTKRLFRKGLCPPQLEKIVKHIIQQCRGLPLSIVVMVGLLGKMEPTHNNWKRVEENMNSFFGTVFEQCESILSFSYTYLPQHLKACFLYVGGFPEDMEISVSKLIRLWIAEKFIKASSHKMLEVVAEECLQELIDRSLILVGRRRPDGRIKSCKIHDVLRELCIKNAQVENVVYVMNHNVVSIALGNQRRVMVPITSTTRNLDDDVTTTSTTHSLVFTTNLYRPSVERLCSLVSHLKLLRVLDVLSIRCDFSDIIPGLIHLRYVAAKIAKAPSLAKLWSLQTIIFGVLEEDRMNSCWLKLSPEIWTLSEIRHLHLTMPIGMPNPVEVEGNRIGEQHLFLNKLQRLYLDDSPFLEEILRRTPNLIKLKISFRCTLVKWSAFLDCLILLQGLETLHIRFSRLRQNLSIPSCWYIHPPNLKKLNLVSTFFPWEDMIVLADLPNLEVLKLRVAFEGERWRLDEDAVFRRLKYLKIEGGNLIRWEATSDNFPMLEHLILRDLSYLEEIPQSMGEITTLKFITIADCSSGVVRSAKKIKEEQESWGNYELQVQIRYVKTFFE